MTSLLPELLKVAAQSPFTGPACQAVVVMYTVADNVKIHKQRCRHLRNSCIETLLALNESNKSYGEGSQQMRDALADFEGKVLKIHNRMDAWAKLSTMKSIIKKDEISLGLDECYKDLQMSSNRFQLLGAVEVNRMQIEQQRIHERDQAELREQLLVVVRQQDVINSLLTNTNDVKSIMQTIQEEIRQSEPSDAAGEYDRHQLEETLYMLHKEANVLPPITDLTHEVRRVSEYPVAHGGDNDVYIGEWLGQEKVALKFSRGFNHSEVAKKKFYNEVGIWRKFQHPNIVRLYGTATIGGCIYTVMPWMDNGDALRFLSENPDTDKKKLLLEIAQGLHYLHQNGVAHGDLRCVNILITKHRVACISDFGLSVLISDIEEEAGADPSTRDPNLGSLRWRAPELIEFPTNTRPIITPATDVWSYGMLCLEVMTGQRPYHGLGMNDVAVMKAISSGKLPNRPSDHTARGLDNTLWQIMQRCWQFKADDRPSISQIINHMKKKVTTITSGPITGSPKSLNPGTLPSEVLVQASTSSPGLGHSFPGQLSPSRGNYSLDQRPRSGTTNSTSTFNSQLKITHRRPSSSSSAGGISQSPSSNRYTPSSHELFPSPQSPSSSASSTRSLSFSQTASGFPTPSGYQRPSLDSQGAMMGTLGGEQDSFSLSITPPAIVGLGEHEEQFFRFEGLALSESPPIARPSMASSQRTGSSHSSQMPFDAASEVALKYSSTGQVTLGNIAGLLHRLLVETNSLDLDLQFRDAFLTCYTAFSSADEVYSALEKRYRSAEQTNLTHSVDVRNVILNVMRRWLDDHRVFPKDAVLLQLMKTFAQSVGQNPSALSTIKHHALLLLGAINKRETELNKGTHLHDKAHSTRVYTGFKASTAHPRDFAIALTIWAGDLYSDLLKSDFVSWVEGSTGKQFVENHLILWNKLSLWTRKMVLENQNEEVRTARLTLFISIAQECRKLRNYMCMAAIASACSSPSIMQLKHTYGDLKKEAKEALNTMSTIMESRDNFKRYRDELQADARHKRPLIPDLAIHTRDVKVLWSQTLSSTLDNGYEMINFKRYTTVTETIKKVLSFQHPPVDLERFREAGALAYLESTLNDFEVTTSVEQYLHTRADQLKQSETLAYENRVRELRDAGFGRPKPKPRRTG